ncbi:hypothetical protein [Jidongwangia harbinensis]|uniref:hypothetical protein n=1 Tax=Jidongwangia harbinensis TaxID=2878561 RepID=UPI001CDA2C72|nr:hypothetical protein [Jidongwangia harbinensis]MCA2211316.1 hypothetical protein [Jidongwangia harbinensis]
MTELVYGRGTRSADEVQREIDRFWAELEHDDKLQAELRAAGLDLRAVPPERRPEAIQVRVRGAGLDPTSVALIVAFAPVANAVLVSLWEQVLLPKIRDRFGRDAIRDEETTQP